VRSVETYSFATRPFEPTAELAEQIRCELLAEGVNAVEVRLYGAMVEVDVEPVGEGQLLLIEGIILAVLSIFGIAVGGMFLTKFWPVVVLGIAVGGAVALAWIFRPPPGGEEVLSGLGAVAGRASEIRMPNVKLPRIRGGKKQDLLTVTKTVGKKGREKIGSIW